MTLDSIWLRNFSSGDLGSVEYLPSLSLLPSSLFSGLVVPIRIRSMNKIDLFTCLLKVVIIIIIIIIPREFFTSALADVLSLEFEWLQVSSSSQDSSRYSGRSQ